MTATTNIFLNLLETIDIDADNLLNKLPNRNHICSRRNLFFICMAGILGITYYTIFKRNYKPKGNKGEESAIDDDLPPYLNKDF